MNGVVPWSKSRGAGRWEVPWVDGLRMEETTWYGLMTECRPLEEERKHQRRGGFR